MANTIPAAIVTAAYDAMNVVSQELIGLIPAVSKNAKADRVAVGQSITAPVVGAKTASDITPGHAYSNPEDSNYDSVSVTMTKQKKTEFHWTGEEERNLLESDGVLMDINRQNIAQCIRTLVNEIEVDIGAEYVRASRSPRTPSASGLFGTQNQLDELSDALRVLDENGAPPMGRSVVLSEVMARRLQGLQPTLFNVNEGGELRRSFNPISLFGATVRMSHAMPAHTTGAVQPATALVNGALDVGDTEIAWDGNNRIALRAGDIVTFAGDGDNYYVVEEDAGASSTGFRINRPGLRVAIADNAQISKTNVGYNAALAFSMDALMLACRVPAVPEGGDLGMRTYLQDPRSGLVFELATFPQYRQRTYEVGIVWGVETIKPDHMALVMP